MRACVAILINVQDMVYCFAISFHSEYECSTAVLLQNLRNSRVGRRMMMTTMMQMMVNILATYHLCVNC